MTGCHRTLDDSPGEAARRFSARLRSHPRVGDPIANEGLLWTQGWTGAAGMSSGSSRLPARLLHSSNDHFPGQDHDQHHEHEDEHPSALRGLI
jgi:hypothetical protein